MKCVENERFSLHDSTRLHAVLSLSTPRAAVVAAAAGEGRRPHPSASPGLAARPTAPRPGSGARPPLPASGPQSRARLEWWPARARRPRPPRGCAPGWGGRPRTAAGRAAPSAPGQSWRGGGGRRPGRRRRRLHRSRVGHGAARLPAALVGAEAVGRPGRGRCGRLSIVSGLLAAALAEAAQARWVARPPPGRACRRREKAAFAARYWRKRVLDPAPFPSLRTVLTHALPCTLRSPPFTHAPLHFSHALPDLRTFQSKRHGNKR